MLKKTKHKNMMDQIVLLKDEELKSFLTDFQFFLNSYERNKYVENNELKVFFRKGVHCVRGTELDQFIDIGNITVYEPNKGIFTKVLKALLELYPEANIFIESVQNPAVDGVVKKFKGFKKQIVSPETYNLYLLRNI